MRAALEVVSVCSFLSRAEGTGGAGGAGSVGSDVSAFSGFDGFEVGEAGLGVGDSEPGGGEADMLCGEGMDAGDAMGEALVGAGARHGR